MPVLQSIWSGKNLALTLALDEKQQPQFDYAWSL